MAQILIIDDDEKARAMLRLVLESAGHEVLEAADGNEADAVQLKRPAQLVITDVIMPEKDGFEVLMDFHRKSPGIKVIAISGGGRVRADDYLALAKKLGAARTFSKPFSAKEILAAVSELLPTGH